MVYTKNVYRKGLAFQRFILQWFEVKTFCMSIHLWIIESEPRQPNDDKVCYIENYFAKMWTNGNYQHLGLSSSSMFSHQFLVNET
jgi:hypothetical protein